MPFEVKLIRNLVFFLVLTWSMQSHANTDEIRRAVALADYISADYALAVDHQGGHILNAMEYAEMQDFAGLIRGYLKSSPGDSMAQALEAAIQGKKTVEEVGLLAQELRNLLVLEFSIATAPTQKPDLKKGETIYLNSCAMCHGKTGEADTPLARQLNPPPARFVDPERLLPLSPFKAFNTILYGVQNTSMPSFNTMTEDDIWAVASYLFLLRDGFVPSSLTPVVAWDRAMGMTDQEILDFLKAKGYPKDQVLSQLAAIRGLGRDQGFDESHTKSGIQEAIQLLDQSLIALASGDKNGALDFSVKSYLDGFEISESVLGTMEKGELVHNIEGLYLKYRQQIREKNAEAAVTGQSLKEKLQVVLIELKASRSLSPTLTFLASFLIVLREGMEAILLLAVILSAVHGIGRPVLKRWVHSSWISSILAGCLTWVVAHDYISGSARENMEGWISLVAAGVLFYVSYWLLSKRDAQKWQEFLLGKIQGKKWGLFSLCFVSFLAVYREIFESILFIEALGLQTPYHFHLGLGVLGGLLSLVLVAWLILLLEKRLPLNLFFGASSFFLYFLAVVFMGQGIHSLQESMVFSANPIPFVTLPALGIYPSLEGVLAQGVFVMVFISTLFWQQWIGRLGAVQGK